MYVRKSRAAHQIAVERQRVLGAIVPEETPLCFKPENRVRFAERVIQLVVAARTAAGRPITISNGSGAGHPARDLPGKIAKLDQLLADEWLRCGHEIKCLQYVRGL